MEEIESMTKSLQIIKSDLAEIRADMKSIKSLKNREICIVCILFVMLGFFIAFLSMLFEF